MIRKNKVTKYKKKKRLRQDSGKEKESRKDSSNLGGLFATSMLAYPESQMKAEKVPIHR